MQRFNEAVEMADYLLGPQFDDYKVEPLYEVLRACGYLMAAEDLKVAALPLGYFQSKSLKSLSNHAGIKSK